MGNIRDRGIRGKEYNDKLLRMRGSSWVEPTGSSFFYDDMIGDTLVADKWLATSTVAAGVGAAAFAIDATAGDPVAGHAGWASGTCSDNAASAEELAGLAIWRPSRAGNGLLVFQTRISNAASVAAKNWAVGLTSARTYGNNLAANISGTTVLVTGMANGAVWLFDTRATASTIAVGIMVDNDVDSAANSTLAAQGAETQTVAKSYVYRVELDANGNAYFYEGVADQPDTYQAGTNFFQPTAGATLKATLLAPYFGIDNAATAANKALELDYCFVACAR